MDVYPLVIVVISEIVSLYLLKRVWLSSQVLSSKVFITIILLMPILGPVSYLIAFDAPPRQKLSSQNRSSSTSNLWGWGSYFREWEQKKHSLQHRIDIALKEAEKDNDETK